MQTADNSQDVKPVKLSPLEESKVYRVSWGLSRDVWGTFHHGQRSDNPLNGRKKDKLATLLYPTLGWSPWFKS